MIQDDTISYSPLAGIHLVLHALQDIAETEEEIRSYNAALAALEMFFILNRYDNFDIENFKQQLPQLRLRGLEETIYHTPPATLGIIPSKK